MQLDALVASTIAGLQVEYPDLARGIQKWSQFLQHSIVKVSRITGTSQEDVLGEILLGLVKVNEMYRLNLYRYKGNLFRIKAFDGKAVLVETLPHNKKLHLCFWTHCFNLESVQRAKIESTVYREIHQQYVNLLAVHFTAKRGYEPVGFEEKAVIVRGGSQGVFTEKRKIKKVRKAVHLVDVDVPSGDWDNVDRTQYPSSAEIVEYLSDYESNPEQQLISGEAVESLGSVLSVDALVVLGCLLDAPDVNTRSITETVSMSNQKVQIARYEIMRGYTSIAGMRHPFLQGTKPVYLRADQVC